MINFDIKNRFTGDVQVTAEIDCDENTDNSIKLGLAIICAVNDGADLSGAKLKGATFKDIILKGVPKIDKIHQKVYEAASKENALDMDAWHTCETTHCRAGWVTTLAGEEGQKLEEKIRTANAALLIYIASDPDYISRDGIPDFYTDNEPALADMKRLADLEAAQSNN